jgi:hypothetical protein
MFPSFCDRYVRRDFLSEICKSIELLNCAIRLVAPFRWSRYKDGDCEKRNDRATRNADIAERASA